MYYFYELLLYGLLSLPIIIFFGLFIVSILTQCPKRSRADFLQPQFIYHPSGVYSQQFPSLLRSDTVEWRGPQHTKPELYLSIVVPAMNEKDRLPKMLDSCLNYLKERKEKNPTFTYEIIVVDDGSSDGTPDVAYDYTDKFDDDALRVLKLPKNVGKGGAIRFGVLCARGQLILFADADDATTFSNIKRLEEQIVRLCNGEIDNNKNKAIDWTHPAVVVGSRMIGFHVLVYLFTVRTVRDTQCGFKMFSRAAAAKLFPQMHIERWAFDVELLYLAERFNIPIAEVPVQWIEVDGSKITPFFSWIQMGRDILLIWFRYTFRLWRTNDLKL